MLRHPAVQTTRGSKGVGGGGGGGAFGDCMAWTRSASETGQISFTSLRWAMGSGRVRTGQNPKKKGSQCPWHKCSVLHAGLHRSHFRFAAQLQRVYDMFIVTGHGNRALTKF